MEDERPDNVEEEDSQEEEMDQEQTQAPAASQQQQQKGKRRVTKRQVQIRRRVHSSRASVAERVARRTSSR